MREEKKPDSVIAILTAWLREHGYDGLCNPDFQCGCGVDRLAPCAGGSAGGGIPEDCQPAHQREVKPGEWRYMTDDWEPEEEDEWE